VYKVQIRNVREINVLEIHIPARVLADSFRFILIELAFLKYTVF
jgi:hypothetical protein